jgi:hypothetical protein
MSPEVVIECGECNYKDRVEFPDLPKNERLFAPDEVDYETSQKIRLHHFNTGVEMGQNNRHGGHQIYSVKIEGNLVGTIRKRWDYLRFTPI